MWSQSPGGGNGIRLQGHQIDLSGETVSSWAVGFHILLTADRKHYRVSFLIPCTSAELASSSSALTELYVTLGWTHRECFCGVSRRSFSAAECECWAPSGNFMFGGRKVRKLTENVSPCCLQNNNMSTIRSYTYTRPLITRNGSCMIP